MVKILAQAGNSLADIYDAEGSIAGIEALETRELPIVHEMGHTVFSERLGGTIRRLATAGIAQSTAFDVVLSNLPEGPWRVLGVTVLADIAARVGFASIALRSDGQDREVPIYVWDSTNNVESDVRIVEDGAAATTWQYLVPNPLQVPNLGIGEGQPRVLDELALRGVTAAFGAGTVTIIGLVYLAFTQTTSLSSRGLPIPGW